MPRHNIAELGKATRFTSGNKAVESGRNGGLSRSPAKSRGQKLRYLKKQIATGNLKDKDIEYIVEQLENPDVIAADMLGLLNEIKNSKMMIDSELRLKTVKAYNETMKTLHGEKIKIQSNNINTNINVEVKGYVGFTPDEWDDHENDKIMDTQ